MGNVIDSSIYFKAKQDLNRFLQQHPDLKPVQAEIDRLLDNAGSEENRVKIVKLLLENIGREMAAAAQELQAAWLKAMEEIAKINNKGDGAA